MPPTQPKRVLIVDDDPNVVSVLSIVLEKLGENYVFDTASNGHEALAKVKQNDYALLITDYNMPEINGLDLAQAVYQISVDTQVILMTGYGTNRLRETLDRFKLAGYIDKPFTADQIRQVVKHAVEHTNQAQSAGRQNYPNQPFVEDAAHEHLKSLRSSTSARCVLLLSSNGFPVSVVGQTKDFDVSTVSALVAANFLAAIELANLLGSSTSVFKSSYHEGNDYNIYSYDINGDLLLAVILDAERKPGVVWFYTKQIAAELAALATQNQIANFTLTDTEVDAALDLEFNELFEVQVVEENDFVQAPNEQTQASRSKGQSNKPMSFEQAVAAGLVPSQIINRDNKK
jgi:CheY-like chemotaxis protein/predicted regulator of Ras-like GTPase activity (Roadblock/LC7/MglB family)